MKAWVGVAAVLLGGCATSRSSQGSEATDGGPEASSYLSQLEEMWISLSSHSASRHRPDCDHLCSLETAICDLSRRICDISARHPESSDIANQCAEGHTRCAEAGDELKDACTCPAP